ncbi:MAG: hypothetical protein G01um101418_621 [Parcubacteria group bacterium Gr01-1014_18]|nr:MAG: hypothetical protein Greene041636_88 [Parcubacteria group bacterium Greene0416_36]TSC80873.1 MAG: hypothetical protein G01um101418_621 [Parcubacteria group bacterium Gr01-1014_18]TSC99534.1 MAG: hypothetical protein Greene101420_201 [Parcubacteria group bacterium Greene1014_20]TSD07547.1 MAG: hypothetical protein Greene07142_4 [Parcubacteria group bacterium Greene0714_2]
MGEIWTAPQKEPRRKVVLPVLSREALDNIGNSPKAEPKSKIHQMPKGVGKMGVEVKSKEDQAAKFRRLEMTMGVPTGTLMGMSEEHQKEFLGLSPKERVEWVANMPSQARLEKNERSEKKKVGGLGDQKEFGGVIVEDESKTPDQATTVLGGVDNGPVDAPIPKIEGISKKTSKFYTEEGKLKGVKDKDKPKSVIGDLFEDFKKASKK